jgi:hypothetical protein
LWGISKLGELVDSITHNGPRLTRIRCGDKATKYPLSHRMKTLRLSGTVEVCRDLEVYHEAKQLRNYDSLGVHRSTRLEGTTSRNCLPLAGGNEDRRIVLRLPPAGGIPRHLPSSEDYQERAGGLRQKVRRSGLWETTIILSCVAITSIRSDTRCLPIEELRACSTLSHEERG